jgi:taurine dioxygenase
VHPVTGERGLFVNPGFTSRILDVRPEESTALLAMLFAHLTADTYTVRFHWEPGSVAFWDNRATAHRGPQDIDHLDVERVLHRVTLLGEVPAAPDGRSSELIEGRPFTAPGADPDPASATNAG